MCEGESAKAQSSPISCSAAAVLARAEASVASAAAAAARNAAYVAAALDSVTAGTIATMTSRPMGYSLSGAKILDLFVFA